MRPVKNDWDWRKENRTEAGLRAMKWISRGLNVASFACFLTSRWFREEWLLSAVCMAVTAVSLVLYIAFPQYLTLLNDKELRKLGCTTKVYDLQLGVMACLSLMLAVFGNFREIEWILLLPFGVLLCAAVCLSVRRLSRELRLCTTGMRATLAMLTLFSALGVVGWGNYLLDFDAEPQLYIVEDVNRHSNGRRGSSYTCEIELESGERATLPIRAAMYRTLAPGDSVLAYVGRGGLGIRYGYVSDLGPTAEEIMSRYARPAPTVDVIAPKETPDPERRQIYAH